VVGGAVVVGGAAVDGGAVVDGAAVAGGAVVDGVAVEGGWVVDGAADRVVVDEADDSRTLAPEHDDVNNARPINRTMARRDVVLKELNSR